MSRTPRARAAVVGLAVAAVVGAGAFAGCGSSDDDKKSSSTTATSAGGGGGGAETAKVSFSSPGIDDPFQAIMQRQTVEVMKERGHDVLSPTSANRDPGKQITDVQNLIASGAEGLIVVPQDSDAIVPAIEFAKNRDIPVVGIDTAPNGGDWSILVRADNVLMGRLNCEFIGRRLGGRGKVLELQGDLAQTNARDRTDGFEDCMEEQFPEIEVIARPTNWQTQRVTDAVQTTLTAEPDLGAIYMQSDSVMTAPVLNALKQAGKDAKVGERGHIVLTSVDGTPLALEKIRSGEQDAAAAQPLNLYARYGVDYLERAIAGEEFRLGPTDHGTEIVDYKGNLMDLLPSPLVTKENVDDRELWGNQAGVDG